MSVALAVTPSRIFNSAAVEVTPSRIFNSAAVDVTPSRIFNSAAVDVAPSRMLSSAAVDVTPSRIFNSSVVTVAPSKISNSASVIVALPITKLVPVIAVPVIAAALEPPIIAPSTVPPFISAVSATKASVVTVPSKKAALNSKELVPKSISLAVEGTIAPLVNVTWLSPPAAIVISSEPLKVIEVLESASPEILSNCILPTLVIAESLKSIVPVTSKLPPTDTLPVVVIASI